jgi:hypothetical protein
MPYDANIGKLCIVKFHNQKQGWCEIPLPESSGIFTCEEDDYDSLGTDQYSYLIADTPADMGMFLQEINGIRLACIRCLDMTPDEARAYQEQSVSLILGMTFSYHEETMICSYFDRIEWWEYGSDSMTYYALGSIDSFTLVNTEDNSVLWQRKRNSDGTYTEVTDPGPPEIDTIVTAEAGEPAVGYDFVILSGSGSTNTPDRSVTEFEWIITRAGTDDVLMIGKGKDITISDIGKGIYDAELIVTASDGTTGSDTTMFSLTGCPRGDADGDCMIGLSDVIGNLNILSDSN